MGGKYPCNIHLHDFGKLAKEGVKDAGAWPVHLAPLRLRTGSLWGLQDALLPNIT